MEKGALQRENGENNKRQKLHVKEKILPNSPTVSQQGNVGPSMSRANGP